MAIAAFFKSYIYIYIEHTRYDIIRRIDKLYSEKIKRCMMYMYNAHEKVFNKDWEKNREIPCYLGDISEMCQLHNKTFDIV